ncbi:hypothetical protein EVAR_87464_1 [Eumeta japonica]|uniref:Uncharacterized protein n=1 Tax=Eumeta variegata TaxID=151549 RepID=A0A4C1W0D3_EUMVA|nr:hypothetical protein EVAR_87464_1 [Eumeta japonica]
MTAIKVAKGGKQNSSSTQERLLRRRAPVSRWSRPALRARLWTDKKIDVRERRGLKKDVIKIEKDVLRWLGLIEKRMKINIRKKMKRTCGTEEVAIGSRRAYEKARGEVK